MISDLTARELEVIELMIQGLITKEIADRLKISERTVKEHRHKVMEKAGARTAAHLGAIIVKAQAK